MAHSSQLKACEDAGITTFVHRPMTSNAKAEGRFDKVDFKYIAKDDEYQCPAGERAIHQCTTTEKGPHLHLYWSSACPKMSSQCACTTSSNRRIHRWEHEEVLTRVQRA